MPPQKRELFGLLDSVIVLFISSIAILLLLWFATTLADRAPVFQTIPAWLQTVASSLWTYLTAGGTAGGALLTRYLQHKDPATRLPNYLLAIVLTTIGGLAVVFASIMALVKIVPVRDSAHNIPFSLHFVLNMSGQGGDYPPLSMIQQHPTPSGPIGLAALREAENYVYKTQISLPNPGEAYDAIVHRSYMDVSQKSANYYVPDWPICFLRKARDPQDGALNPYAFLNCDEGKGCVVPQKGDPGWAMTCPVTGSILPVVHAQGKTPRPAKEGWLTPSLQALAQLNKEKGIGYTSFQIKSDPRSDLVPGDYFTYQISVNGSPVAVDGWRSDLLRVPINSSRSIELSFGLENLDFSGADNGCENIEVAFNQIRKTGGPQKWTLYRKYVALRDPNPVTISAPDGIKYAWTGQFIPPRAQDKNEVFVASTSDVRYAISLKSRIDSAGLKFEGKELAAVIRPPLQGSSFGVILALRDPSGRLSFTFEAHTAKALANWITADRATRASRAFQKPVSIYALRGDSANNPAVCKESGYRP